MGFFPPSTGSGVRLHSEAIRKGKSTAGAAPGGRSGVAQELRTLGRQFSGASGQQAADDLVARQYLDIEIAREAAERNELVAKADPALEQRFEGRHPESAFQFRV